eukprot:TRINITY_DN12499_c0_g1_i1.p1 TRINITY_DN12499_c0_g1~~TRINITY_DN12499_c0_g1_i1.p1  ORF type:complete len:197 (+),score=53.05 TRINITY_DN12499_c0_g1_i1:86-676(+)
MNDINVSVTIPATKIVKGEKGKSLYTIYFITITLEKNMIKSTWSIERRFTDFFELRKQLKQDFPTIREIQFPTKKLVNNFTDKTINKRKKTFQQFFTQILQQLRTDSLLINEAFCNFLEIPPGAIEKMIDNEQSNNNQYQNNINGYNNSNPNINVSYVTTSTKNNNEELIKVVNNYSGSDNDGEVFELDLETTYQE